MTSTDSEFGIAEGPDDAENDARRREFWLTMFGIEPAPWGDETLAPPIDDEAQRLLRLVAQRKATDECDQEIYDLCLRFRSWAKARVAIELEEGRLQIARGRIMNRGCSAN